MEIVKVKIINSDDEIDFENKVNDFISKHKVTDMQYDYSAFLNNRTIHRYSVLIIYEEE